MKILYANFWEGACVENLNHRHRGKAFQCRMIVTHRLGKPKLRQIGTGSLPVVHTGTIAVKEQKL